MNKIFLVTGNANKLEEWRRQLPADIEIDSVDLDLPEIQSIDPEEIMADKAKRAFVATGKPVVVEDVSAGLEKLGGLPGPFVKFFIKKLGDDVLYQLAGGEGEPAVVSCSIAYYDGNNLVTVRGDIKGTAVQSRGENGFGFDKTFVPEGHDRTYAEMSGEEKDEVSHRSVAIKLLVEKLRSGQSQPDAQKDIVDDNARKFIVEPLDDTFLEKSKTAFLLATDWFETGEDSERKVAHKTYTNGDVKIFLISKTTKGGRRVSERQPISEEEYTKLLEGSIRHLEKMRYEFDYEQNGTVFDVKYDVFSNSDLRVLEVDAETEEERISFKPSDFPNKLTEVTGELQYYGYRVASIV